MFRNRWARMRLPFRIAVTLALLLGWWLYRRRSTEETAFNHGRSMSQTPVKVSRVSTFTPAQPRAAEPPQWKPDDTAHTDAGESSSPAESQEPDDLTVIEGIGPKVATLLRAAGITTFEQLAQTDVERLRQILRAAGLPMLLPDTWPEQARIAAQGDQERLDALQNELKAGRRK